MTTGRGIALLRDPAGPQQVTALELFFDLVFVFALFQVSGRLAGAFHGAGQLPSVGYTVLLLLALWMVWSLTAWTTTIFDPWRLPVQLVVAGTMFGSMVMAVRLPATSERGVLFASAYVAIQVGRPIFLVLAIRCHEQRVGAVRSIFWSLLSAAPWLVGAFARNELRGVLWAVAIVIDYLGFALRWPTPALGRSRQLEGSFASEHLAERYQQFLIIALGESILVIGRTFSASLATAPSTAFILAFVSTALLWRIYFHRAGYLLAEAITAAPQPVRLATSAGNTHLIMVAGIIATAVGHELVIAHPFGTLEATWIAVIFGGPALFLAGRSRFEYEVFGRVSGSRLIGLLALIVLAPVMVLVPPLAAASAATAVLAGIAGTDAVRARQRPQEPPSPPALAEP
ncbi:membrane protein [Micromonospora qiuiae]|uniref:Membrane protein n=1 Tax=Micromonospora qiuiae TaxID=502268 RepID=A0ABQ4JJC2_9ACTN|nr:low temperature requirement protein A [Micromonospora qiuiae]GIJ29564.1 membrane protein [Micromonospora qiuiae]